MDATNCSALTYPKLYRTGSEAKYLYEYTDEKGNPKYKYPRSRLHKQHIHLLVFI